MRRISIAGLCALVAVGVTIAPHPVGATELGGNYNQYLCDIYNGLVTKSGAKWVRVFVNIPRNFLAYDDVLNPNQVTGVQNLTQSSDAVGGASEQLGIQTATKLRQLQHTGARRPAPKVILNLKLDMKYLPDPSAPIPLSQIPAPGSPEFSYWVDAIEQFLTAPGPNVGSAVDVLVLGNEPMFEVPDDPVSVVAYQAFLEALIPEVEAMKNAAAGIDFQVFVGALDKPSASPTNAILLAVIDVVKNNGLVDGLDLHLHEDEVTDVQADLDFIRSTMGVSKLLTVTEFSLVGLWNANANQPLGDWGAQHGYPASMTMAAWLDSLMADASSGDPRPASELESFFEEQPWYPKDWFDTFMTEFEAHDVMAATYGLSAAPNVPDLGPQCAPSGLIPLTPTGEMQLGAYIWVLDFVYNGALLGQADDGFYTRNPLVADAFARWTGTTARLRKLTFTG